MDAAHTVGLLAVTEKKEATCPGVVRKNSDFSKYISITPILFLFIITKRTAPHPPKINTF